MAPGLVSGICVSPLVFFFDLGKNKRQSLGRKIVPSDFLQTRGAITTLVRESLAFSVYFLTYKIMTKDHGFSSFWAGGLSGVASWSATYPLDVIRNRQITHDITATDAMSTGKLWKGFGVCMCRAFMVNSIGFYVFEKSKLMYDATST
jgi:hypothetical protein